MSINALSNIAEFQPFAVAIVLYTAAVVISAMWPERIPWENYCAKWVKA